MESREAQCNVQDPLTNVKWGCYKMKTPSLKMRVERPLGRRQLFQQSSASKLVRPRLALASSQRDSEALLD